MSQIITGDDALDLMDGDAQDEQSSVGFSKFNVGTEYKVKVLGVSDHFAVYSYGIYNVVDSFIAEKPSKKTKKGFPIGDLTPWDKAFLYHRDKSEAYQDKHSNEAYKYRPELRYAMGFFDLSEGERILIDVSRKQAFTIQEGIKRYSGRLDRLAFELAKGQGGSITFAPVIDMEEDLTDKERKNFKGAPEEFGINDYYGVFRVANEKEQIEALIRAGFDVKLIGLEPPAKDDEVTPVEGGEALDIDDEDLPF